MSRVVFVTPILIILLVIPILIGVYVYRDATRRNMNAVLWTLIAVVAPSLIGFIIYLLVRGSYTSLECPKCGAPVTDEYVICPKCGTRLRPACPSCGASVSPDWKLCPRCAADLSGEQPDYTSPVRSRDTALWKILVAIVVVPLLLIAAALVLFSVAPRSGSVCGETVSLDEYYREQTASVGGQVHDWIEGLEARSDRAHVLQYDHEEQGHFFLIYIPAGSGDSPHIGFGSRPGLFRETLILELEGTGNGSGLICISSSSDKAPNLNITLNGRKLPCEITSVDFNPTLFFIVPHYDQLDPSADEIILPERVTVVKYVSNANVGVVELSDEDLTFNLLKDIDSSPYLSREHPFYGKNRDDLPDRAFRDGFEIIIAYRVEDDLILHDEIRCLVFPWNGEYILNDSYRPYDSRIFRQVDEAFYHGLEDLFA